MRHLLHLAVLFVFILFGVVSITLCRGETDPDLKQAEQSILGPWQADSVTLLSESGAKKALSNNRQKPFNIIVAEKTLAMRVGDQAFAEMSYIADSKKSPASIDVKLQGQDMPGIFELKGDKLKISLNEAKKGRPEDFGGNSNDMDLVLHRFQGRPLMMINEDGSNLRVLLSMPEYASCGSPKWSPDGGKIAFDAWRSVFGETYINGHVFTADIDGGLPKDLGEGTLPSWSPDGKRIVYYRRNPGNQGVWIMNADGSDNRLIDAEGSSADWSPKRDELAYEIENNTKLCVRDLNTQVRRNLLEKEYTQIYRGLSWSPDGRWICFKADLPDGSSEVAIVSAEGQAKGFKVLLPDKAIPGVKEFDRFFSWSPDGKRILMPIIMEGDANHQLYILDPDGKAPPQKLAGQDPSHRYFGACWSPDGKRIVLTDGPGNPAQNTIQTKSLLNRILNLE